MIMKKNIAIFASGNGSNAENIVRYFRTRQTAAVALVLANRPDAYVLQRAQRLEVPAFYCPKADWVDGRPILELLRAHKVDFVALAGFLLRVPDNVLHAYQGRMVNIHPSLLPKFGGKGMYGDRVHQAVLEAGEAESGITIHYTTERYDEGAIVCQRTCPVLPADTPDTLAQRVHALEYDTYPAVIERLVCAL